MILQAGGLGVEIDIGDNIPGAIQRLEEGEWRNFEQGGKPVTWPVKLEQLAPGRYRVLSA